MRAARCALGILACVAVVAACENTADLDLQAQACPATLFSTGYMVRLPHEPHSAERCVQVQTRAPPRFVPDVAPFFHSPLHQTKEPAR